MIYRNAVAEPRQELTDVVMEGVTSSTQFVGLRVLPAVPMTLPTGHYPKITIATGDLMRATAAKRQPGMNFERWKSQISDGSINLVQLGEELQIPDEAQLTYEDYFPLESIYAKESANRLQRAHEIEAAATLQDSNTFDAVNAIAAYTAANLANGTIDFVGDVLAAILRVKARGEAPNTVVLNNVIYNRIRQASLTKSFVAGSVNPGAIVSPSTLQRAFADEGITQVLIGGSYVNLSAAGQNDNIVPTWSNASVFVGNVAEGQLISGGVGRTFFWEKEGPIFNIQTYREEPKKSNIIRAQSTKQCVVVNARAGTLVTTNYTA